MSKKLFLILLAPLLVLLGVGYLRLRTPQDTWICQGGQWVKHGNPSFPMPSKLCEAEGEIVTAKDKEDASLANPASQNCLDKGGELGYRQETAGTLGICRFDDTTECEEWQFFRGECQKGQLQTADTSHPYRGVITKSGQSYTFKTESGQEYNLELPPEAQSSLINRLEKEITAGQPVTIVASETPPLSRTLILRAFQEK